MSISQVLSPLIQPKAGGAMPVSPPTIVSVVAVWVVIPGPPVALRSRVPRNVVVQVAGLNGPVKPIISARAGNEAITATIAIVTATQCLFILNLRASSLVIDNGKIFDNLRERSNVDAKKVYCCYLWELRRQ